MKYSSFIRLDFDNFRVIIRIYDVNNKQIHFKIYRCDYVDYMEIYNYFKEFRQKNSQAYSYDYKIEETRTYYGNTFL